MLYRNHPYVGVSGVVNHEQQRELTTLAHGYDLSPKRRLLLGVKATHKTQYLDVPNRYGEEWYPVGESVFSNAFSEDEWATYNVAQVYLEPEWVRHDSYYPDEFVQKLIRRGGVVLHALQFDMLPYNEDPSYWAGFIDRVKDTNKGVIIQSHAAAMSKGPEKAVEDLVRLSERSSLDFVLFDASHGTGKEMDTDRLKYFLDAAYANSDLKARDTNFGIAGGLDEFTVKKHLPHVVKDFPEISWDAEGRLHARDGVGRLDMEKTRDYLFASARVLAALDWPPSYEAID